MPGHFPYQVRRARASHNLYHRTISLPCSSTVSCPVDGAIRSHDRGVADFHLNLRRAGLFRRADHTRNIGLSCSGGSTGHLSHPRATVEKLRNLKSIIVFKDGRRGGAVAPKMLI